MLKEKEKAVLQKNLGVDGYAKSLDASNVSVFIIRRNTAMFIVEKFRINCTLEEDVEKIIMKNNIEELSRSAQAYSVAYKEHYSNNNLKEAFNLYRDIIAVYPESQEATYSKEQIKNIVAIMVPAQEIFDAQVNMALAHFR